MGQGFFESKPYFHVAPCMLLAGLEKKHSHLA